VVEPAGPSAVRFEVHGSVGPLIKALAGYPVESLVSREATLEEVFLHHYDHSDGSAGG
jgi:ABC-2 type transport system ATP-binding protein